jgi:F0F1-type ATP synthase assembly protein I
MMGMLESASSISLCWLHVPCVWFTKISTAFFTSHRPPSKQASFIAHEAIKLLDCTCLVCEALHLLTGESFLLRKDVMSWQQKPN